MPRYFFTSLANRPIRVSGREIRFDICSIHGGKAAGVYAAEDPAIVAGLDDMVRGRRGVTEIGADEYEELKKKASQTPQSANSNGFRRPRVVRIPTLPEASIETRAGVASADLPGGGKLKPGESLFSGPAPTSPPPTKSLIRIEKVSPPRPFATSVEKVRKASSRADRAKVRIARKAVS